MIIEFSLLRAEIDYLLILTADKKVSMNFPQQFDPAIQFYGEICTCKVLPYLFWGRGDSKLVKKMPKMF